MAQNLEDVLPPIQSAGLNTLKATSLGSTLAVTGATTLASTLAVTGASTFTGAATFAVTPVFSGGRLATVSSLTSATTATVTQSGSTILFNSTTGVAVTLPTPTVGTFYDFVVAQTPSTGTHGIRTGSGSVFLNGGLSVVTGTGGANVGTIATFTFDGSSNTGVSLNGTTTGGVKGTAFRVVATSTTVWAITGQALATGATLATPVF